MRIPYFTTFTLVFVFIINVYTYVWCSRKTMHIARKKYVVLLLIQNAAPFLKIKQFTLLKYSNRDWIYRIFNKVPVRN